MIAATKTRNAIACVFLIALIGSGCVSRTALRELSDGLTEGAPKASELVNDLQRRDKKKDEALTLARQKLLAVPGTVDAVNCERRALTERSLVLEAQAELQSEILNSLIAANHELRSAVEQAASRAGVFDAVTQLQKEMEEAHAAANTSDATTSERLNAARREAQYASFVADVLKIDANALQKGSVALANTATHGLNRLKTQAASRLSDIEKRQNACLAAIDKKTAAAPEPFASNEEAFKALNNYLKAVESSGEAIDYALGAPNRIRNGLLVSAIQGIKKGVGIEPGGEDATMQGLIDDLKALAVEGGVPETITNLQLKDVLAQLRSAANIDGIKAQLGNIVTKQVEQTFLSERENAEKAAKKAGLIAIGAEVEQD